MGGSAPSVPQVNTAALDQQQQGYNQLAAEQSLAGSMVGQQTPFGSLSYSQTGTGPGGFPTYTATTQLSPQEQAIFGGELGTQQQAATAGNEILRGANYGDSNPITDIGNMTSGLTSQQMSAFLKGEEPFFNYQTEALDSQLANQGLTPGSPAYAQAKNLLEQNQGNVVSSAEAAFEPQAFNQAVDLYGMPLSTAESLYTLGSPANLAQNLINTPTASVSPVNAIGAQSAANQAAIAQAQLQQNQYSSELGGLFGLGVAGIKALPFV